MVFYEHRVTGRHPRTWRVEIVAAVAMSLAACGSQQAPTSPSAPAARLGLATRTIALVGDLTFGDVQIGLPIVSVLDIHNDGNSSLTVSGISLPRGFTADWSSGTIAPAQRQSVGVTFTPAAAQVYNGVVSVVSDATGGVNTTSVSGTGVASGGGVPVLLSPDDGAVLPNSPADNRSVWTFTWAPVPGAASYRLYVKNVGGALPAADVPGLVTTTYTYQVAGDIIAANLTGWQWMVQADGGYSAMRTFSVAPLALEVVASARPPSTSWTHWGNGQAAFEAPGSTTALPVREAPWRIP